MRIYASHVLKMTPKAPNSRIDMSVNGILLRVTNALGSRVLRHCVSYESVTGDKKRLLMEANITGVDWGVI